MSPPQYGVGGRKQMRKGQEAGRGEDSVRGLESRVKSGTDVIRRYSRSRDL